MSTRVGSVFQRVISSWPLLIILFIAWPIFAWASARALIVRDELLRADAIVILAGSATCIERAQHAASLFRQGKAALVILTNDGLRSNWSSERQINPLFVERSVSELERLGVPTEKIAIIWQPPSGTYDEALQVRDYADKHGLRSVLVVTSAYHSRRARWTLKRVFGDNGVTIGIDPAGPGHQTPTAATWWLHFSGWNFVAGEYVKLLYYLLRYSFCLHPS